MPLSPEQLEQRSKLITASDAAAILGLSSYRTAHDVYAEKVGNPAPREESWPIRRGHQMEPLLIDWVQHKYPGKRIVPTGDVTLVHPILTWLGATPDFDVFDGEAEEAEATGDAKSSDETCAVLFDSPRWTDENGDPTIPDYYLTQFQVQMTVRGVQRHYCAVEVLGESEPRIYVTDHDPDFEAAILEELDNFRRAHLLPRVPPPVDGSESAKRMIQAIHPRVRQRALMLAPPELDALGQEYLALATKRKEIKCRQDEILAELELFVGDRLGVKGSGWRLLFDEREESVVPSYVRKAYRHPDVRAVKPRAAKKKKGQAA